MHLSTYSHFRSNAMPMTNRSADTVPGHLVTLVTAPEHLMTLVSVGQCCVGHTGCLEKGHTRSQILTLRLHPSPPNEDRQDNA